MRAGDRAVAVPPAVARLESATIQSIRTSSGSAQSSTRRSVKCRFGIGGAVAGWCRDVLERSAHRITTSTRRGRMLLTLASLLEQCGRSCTVSRSERRLARMIHAGERLRQVDVHRRAARRRDRAAAVVAGVLAAEEADAGRVARIVQPRPRRELVAIDEHPHPRGGVERLLDVAQHRPDIAPVLLASGRSGDRKRLRRRRCRRADGRAAPKSPIGRSRDATCSFSAAAA